MCKTAFARSWCECSRRIKSNVPKQGVNIAWHFDEHARTNKYELDRRDALLDLFKRCIEPRRRGNIPKLVQHVPDMVLERLCRLVHARQPLFEFGGRG